MNKETEDGASIDHTGRMCPWCANTLLLARPAIHNAETGDMTSLLVRAECCGKPVKVTPVRSYSVQAYLAGDRVQDDWNRPLLWKGKP
jgi:hypothetical protein